MRSLTQCSAGPLKSLDTYSPQIYTLSNATTLSHPLPLTSHQTITPPYNQPLAGTPHTACHSFFNVIDNSSLLSAQAKNRINHAIQNSWAPSTIKRYSGAIQQFIDFCESEHVPEHLRFPADEFVLCAFAASGIGKHAGSVPRAQLSALKAWHNAHGIEWRGSTRLRYILNGVENLAPRSSKRSPRPPINAKMLSQLIVNLDLNSPLDAVVAACAVTAFWGQCRLGELLPASLLSTSTNHLPSRSDFKRSLRNPQSCLLHLPRTKSHHHGQDVVLVDQRAPINPISLLKNHLRVNNVPRNSLIFSYSSPNGLLTLTEAHFLQHCNTIWQHFGYSRTTGHWDRFRIGGTTELLMAGTPLDVVKATGRWSTESFSRYLRSDIAPQRIRNLYTLTQKFRRRQSTIAGS